MKNEDLRNEMIEVFKELRKGKIGISEVKQLANVFGKTVSSAKADIEYQKHVGRESPIDFFEK